MEMIIIPEDRVQKLRDMYFDGWNRLAPVEGEMNGVKVYFLRADILVNKIFAKALDDFKTSEIKQIETIDYKYFDSTEKEIVPDLAGVFKDGKGKEISLDVLTVKTVLTEKIIEKVLTEKLK